MVDLLHVLDHFLNLVVSNTFVQQIVLSFILGLVERVLQHKSLIRGLVCLVFRDSERGDLLALIIQQSLDAGVKLMRVAAKLFCVAVIIEITEYASSEQGLNLRVIDIFIFTRLRADGLRRLLDRI